MFVASIGNTLSTITFSKHDKATAIRLEKIYVRVHTTSSGGAHRATSHTGRSLGRTGVIDRMIFDVLRQTFATVDAFFQFGMRDIATYDNSTIQRKTRTDRIFRKFLTNIFHRTIQIDGDNIAFAGIAKFFGNKFVRLIVHLFNPDTIFVDLTFDIAVGRARNAQTNRTAGTMTRQTDNAHIVSKILTTKLCTQTNFVGFFQHLLFKFNIAESTTGFVAGSRQIVVIMSRGKLHGKQVLFGRSTTDNESNVIRRTSRRTQRFHFFHHERHQLLGIQQSLGFLVKIRFIGRSTTLGNAEEMIFHTFGSFDIDLRRKVAFGIHFFVHRKRSILAITQIFFGISFENTQRKSFFVAIAGPHLLTLFTVDDSRTGILTQRQFTLGSHFGITQESQCHIFVVFTSLRIVQNLGNLLVMTTTQEERNIAESRICHSRQTFFFNFQNRMTFEFAH